MKTSPNDRDRLLAPDVNKNIVIDGANWVKMTSPRVRLTVPACHTTKK
jgi:hypothetical protein